MNNNIDFEQIYRHPKFTEMIRRKRRITCGFSIVITLAFILFMAAMSWAGDFLGSAWSAGSAITYGFIFTILIITIAILISGYYIWWANRYFDVMKQELIQELENAG